MSQFAIRVIRSQGLQDVPSTEDFVVSGLLVDEIEFRGGSIEILGDEQFMFGEKLDVVHDSISTTE